MAIHRDLTNFTSAGTLDLNSSQATAQQASCQTSPLPTEEWVCIEDYYSDNEQSEVQTDQAHPAAPTSPLLLPSTAAVTLPAHPSVAPLSSLFASLIATALQSAVPEGQPDIAVGNRASASGSGTPSSRIRARGRQRLLCRLPLR